MEESLVSRLNSNDVVKALVRVRLRAHPPYWRIGDIILHPKPYDGGFMTKESCSCGRNEVMITGGMFMGHDGISNFWYWRPIMENGSLGEEEHGYGFPA